MRRVVLLALTVVSLLALAACEEWSEEEGDYLDWQNDFIERANQFDEQAFARLESAETEEDGASTIEQYLPNLKQIASDAHKRQAVPEGPQRQGHPPSLWVWQPRVPNSTTFHYLCL